MKITALTLGLTMLLLACTQTSKQHATSDPVSQERVSDRYSRKAVKSYEVFHSRIDQHAVMLVSLSTGEHFPMVCRKTANGIYPIPQSVFAASGEECWIIMSEPQVRRGNATVHALTALKFSRADGELFMGEDKLEQASKVALLSAPSL